MKKIYNILLTFVALLAFAPIMGAQTKTIADVCGSLEFPAETTTQISEESNVGFRKIISKPTTDGTYWIKLEAFATGQGTVVQKSVPSDVVLVLDLSSSMVEEYTAGTARPSASYTYNNYPEERGSRYFYRHSDGKFYRVERGGGNNARYLSYNVNGTTWYLNGSGSTTTQTTFRNDQTIFNGVLYNPVSRLAALKEASETFIQSLVDNAAAAKEVDANYPGNRIAVVTYSGTNTGYRPVYDNDYIELASGWEDVTENQSTLVAAINNMNLEGHDGTRPELALQMVIDELADDVRHGANFNVLLFTDGYPVQTYFDGNNQHNVGHLNNPDDNTQYYGSGGTRFICKMANDAIHNAHILKSKYNATIFSVGLISPVNPSEDLYPNYRRVLYMMDLISSNYPDSDFPNTNGTQSDVAWNINSSYAISVTGLSTGDKVAGGNYFQLVDSNTDLSTIFKTISDMSGGTPVALNEASTTVDIVSSSFMLPTGASSSDIKLFVAKCTNTSSNPTPYTFGTEQYHDPTVSGGSSTYYSFDENGNVTTTKVDANLGVTISGAKNDIIEVTGFEYSNNWCGPIKNSQGTITNFRQGYKIIIMIPVKMNPDAIGGPNVATNAEGSGIYENYDPDDPNCKPLVEFITPHVSLPVNVYIEKAGLTGRESAKFSIERAILPDSGKVEDLPADTQWEYVSTVFVTNSPNSLRTEDGNPVVRVKGMPATLVVGYRNTSTGEETTSTTNPGVGWEPIQKGLVYRITEEPWSWSYTIDATPQYTVTDQVDNPFTFTNSKRTAENIDVTVRHAESKVTNIFKSGTTRLYDDSKTNTGREADGPDGLPTTTGGTGTGTGTGTGN